MYSNQVAISGTVGWGEMLVISYSDEGDIKKREIARP
jgi:hypothetical protein